MKNVDSRLHKTLSVYLLKWSSVTVFCIGYDMVCAPVIMVTLSSFDQMPSAFSSGPSVLTAEGDNKNYFLDSICKWSITSQHWSWLDNCILMWYCHKQLNTSDSRCHSPVCVCICLFVFFFLNPDVMYKTKGLYDLWAARSKPHIPYIWSKALPFSIMDMMLNDSADYSGFTVQ